MKLIEVQNAYLTKADIMIVIAAELNFSYCRPLFRQWLCWNAGCGSEGIL